MVAAHFRAKISFKSEEHRHGGASRGMRSLGLLVLLAAGSAVGAEDRQTLEQAASRSSPDFIAVFEGRPVVVRAEVAGPPVWAVAMYYLPLRDATDHGLLLRGEAEQFAELTPGDRIEVRGTIQSRAGLPLLSPSSIQKLGHAEARPPKELTLAELSSFRYLGIPVRTHGTVTSVGENAGGKVLQVTDHGQSILVFLPRTGYSGVELADVRSGDRVQITGLATQYATHPPYDRDFQVMLASAADLEVLDGGYILPPRLLLSALGAIVVLLGVWWIRERRMGAQRREMRALHALSEDIISASAPSEIADKLATVLPTVTQATAARLYLFNRRTKSLEHVPTSVDPEPMAVAIDAPQDGLASGAVVCFRNRTLLNIPDVRRSPLVKAGPKMSLPRSAMFAPLFAKGEVVGVLELGNARRPGYFTLEEQAAAQHLANQVGAALKLQEQQNVREQLFRSEKLAATGQLISGVASELRAPLENIVQLATSLTGYNGRPIPQRELRELASESQRAFEIVSRLVSFARPEASAAQSVDVNALVASLLQFRDPEWKTLGLRVQNRLSPEPALVVGAHGQMEQVFLNLLIHAEQYAAEAPGKTLAIASSVIARRALVEICYSTQAPDGEVHDPFAEGGHSAEGDALDLGVCQGIIQSHGGDIRFRTRSGMAVFEVELPVARDVEQNVTVPEPRRSARALTTMLVDPDSAGQRQLLGLVSARGHRVVPVPLEEAADLAQRLRFDAVFWSMRPACTKWSEFLERSRPYIPAFVLLSDGYDADLAARLAENGGFLMVRPLVESDLDRVLKEIETRAPATSAARPGR